jgi:hypothetical protein
VVVVAVIGGGLVAGCTPLIGADGVTVDPFVVVVVAGTSGGFSGKGVEVNGGGRGPFTSPLTLRLNGESVGGPLSFFLPPFPSLPPADADFASCSSSVCTSSSSKDQKKPFPLSPPHLSSFLNARPEDKL